MITFSKYKFKENIFFDKMNNATKYFRSVIHLIVYTSIGYGALLAVQSSQKTTFDKVRSIIFKYLIWSYINI